MAHTRDISVSRHICSSLLLALVSLFCLAACETTPAPSKGNTASDPLIGRFPISADTEAPDLGALEAYSIPNGQCGMVLYTQSAIRPVPIFRSTDDGKGLMQIEGKLTTLTLVGRGGESRMGVPSQQYFEAGAAEDSKIKAAVLTSWGQTFPSGAYVQEGTITLTAPDGWSRVLPVAGIAGCRL
ncbi:MAG: hypothetical protein AAF603_00355 [Pseudomonadota bacterium]